MVQGTIHKRYSYVYNRLYYGRSSNKRPDRRSLDAAVFEIVHDKTNTVSQLESIIRHIHTLITTQTWAKDQHISSFRTISQHGTLRRIAARRIQRWYLKLLYHPVHAWHGRRHAQLSSRSTLHHS